MKLTVMTIPLLGLGLAVAPAFAAQMAGEQQRTGMPGAINYVEGVASIDGQTISQKQVGSIELSAGQELATGAGKAEVLLTPGVFLRVDSNSAVKMISPDLTRTQVQIDKGRAGIEVDEIHSENNLEVIDAGVPTRLQKTGYYEFDAGRPDVMVFKGKADVQLANEKNKEVKGGHELMLAQAGEEGGKVKTPGIDENRQQDDLLNWSRLRSQYLAEANNEIAGDYAGAGYYPGWYWDSSMFGYTYLGAGPFMSPFGWGFYPLGWGWGGGWYGGGWGGRGWYGRPGYGRGYGHYGTVRGTTRTMPAARTGGFHGGGMAGGFHGGGMAGGFHGGGGRR